MKVILTKNAEENLWQIYRYHADYSVDYADELQNRLCDFIFTHLSEHPKLGTIYNPAQDIYRMVFDRRYNIYYVLRDALYIVFVLDGRMELNTELKNPSAPLPDLN